MRRANKIGVWTMISVLFVQTLGLNMLYEFYALDQAAFVELFCVNQEKPEMACEGSCMLSKMEQQDKNSKDKPARTEIATIQLIFFFQEEGLNLDNCVNSSKIRRNLVNQNLYDSGYLASIFRPPILA